MSAVSDASTPTRDQLHTLRHMLGINTPDDRVPKPYRDHYAAYPGDPELAAMAAAGLVELVRGPVPGMPYDCYRCTFEGRALAMRSHRDIRRGKAQRVYSAYLRVSDAFADLTFREFLTAPDFRDTRTQA